VLVGYAAGSGPDIQARTVSHALSNALGQPFVVENRPGANGTMAVRAVTQADPDGYTLLFSSSSIAPTPYIYRNLGYDLLTDLEPIATIGELDGVFMLVDAKSPIKSVPELIEYAKKNRVLYGSPGVGNELHLKAELFNQQAGIKMEHVPYKGASEVMTGLLSGAVQVMFVTPPSVMGLLKQGSVRALAFTGSKPFPPFPDVPLMKQYLPAYVHGTWGMFFAPAKVPDIVVNKLNGAIHAAFVGTELAESSELATVNGTVDVAWPAAAGAEVSARSVNGRVTVDFPVSGEVAPHKARGLIGHGGKGLTLRSVNGSIHVARGT